MQSDRSGDFLKIAFVHYHLKAGGVTSVIRRQVSAIQDCCEVLVLSGEPSDPDFPAETAVVPALSYDHLIRTPTGPQALADAICQKITAKWPGGCDVLHVHNPTLAKNRHLLPALETLRRRKVRLLLQIHDFAEDGRPAAYSSKPYVPDSHYAVLNGRDGRILKSAGLDSAGLHILPNAVAPLSGTAATAAEDYVLYPVRAIRRKNIGEALLHSCFLPRAAALWITLPPNSSTDLGSYQDWKGFVEQHGLPVEFECGCKTDFNRLVEGAGHLITTSITEGFGFCFLEPWAAGKFLRGRRLPEICRDYEANGVCLDHLYNRLAVPLDWIDAALFRCRWSECYAAQCRRFALSVNAAHLCAGFDRITAGGEIDFGMLHEVEQRSVIERVLEDSGARGELRRRNPLLDAPVPPPGAGDRIARNRAAVSTAYGPSAYTARLLDIYRRAIEIKVRHKIDKHKLLSAFLTPERFSLLKWAKYESERYRCTQ